MRTFVPSATTVTRRWHVIDANGQALGRIASTVATLLQGKHTRRSTCPSSTTAIMSS